MSPASDLVRYYAERAHEYEQVYLKPERQHNIAQLRARLRDLLAGHRVLEVACGTGYWTAAIAGTATSIVATDINEAVLRVAQAKQLPAGKVHFVRALIIRRPRTRLSPLLTPFARGHYESS